MFLLLVQQLHFGPNAAAYCTWGLPRACNNLSHGHCVNVHSQLNLKTPLHCLLHDFFSSFYSLLKTEVGNLQPAGNIFCIFLRNCVTIKNTEVSFSYISFRNYLFSVSLSMFDDFLY